MNNKIGIKTALDKLITHVERHHLIAKDQQSEFESLVAALILAASNNTIPVKPLTDKQLEDIAVSDEFVLSCDVDDFIQIARAVEQAHRVIAKKLNEGL